MFWLSGDPSLFRDVWITKAGCTVSCVWNENIGIFSKIYKSTNPGSNKVVYGPCEQESEEKNQNFDFSICKIVLM